jgi:glycosyltransferase involved in cell wall biosynthesis
MRILFFSSIFPQPGKPTRGIYCFHLCQALSATCEVKVISPWSWLDRRRYSNSSETSSVPESANLDGLAVTYPGYYYTPGLLRSAYGWFMWRSVARCLRQTLEEFRPDCLLSYWAHPDGAVAVRAAQSIGVPSVNISGGSDVLLLTRSRRRRAKIVSALRACATVITVSQSLRAKVIDLGIPAEKVHVVYQGLDTEQFYPGDPREARARLGISHSGLMMLWVGNLLPVKGLDVLLRACASLRERNDSFHLYLVGDGPLRKALENERGARRLSDCVSFVGAQPHHQLPDWFRAADLTILPSRSEGLPNVLRESLACGTPFVASEVGSIREIVGADTRNRLVPPEDADALAEAIHESLQGAKASPAQFPRIDSWAQSARNLLHILEPLIAPPRTGRGPALRTPGLRGAGTSFCPTSLERCNFTPACVDDLPSRESNPCRSV